MDRSRIRILRYTAWVSAIYFLLALTPLLLFAILGATIEPSLWLLPFVMGAFGAWSTLVVIARFGNAGGSIYFVPTVIHATVLLMVAYAFWATA
ncbi:MAG TPA: hypothetical protein VFO36_00890 [Nitrospiraceae bacterium]|nr:hypothetical protein [Nitrospiraceae bacterium]